MTQPTPDDIGSLIRQFCDGELDDERTAAFERRIAADPDLAGQVRFERTLCEKISRAMNEMNATTAPTPADLAPRVRAALAAAAAEPAFELATDSREDGAPTPGGNGLAPAPGAAARPAARPVPRPAARPVPRPAARSWLAGPPRANVFAVAATLAVIAGAVLFGIFGRPIDSVRRTIAEPATEIAQFVSGEHHRCAGDPDARERKATWRGPAAAEGLRGYLGHEVPIFHVPGYQFIGAGRCHIPGADLSAHLVYASTERGSDGCPNATLSLFVVPSDAIGPGMRVGEHWAWVRIGDRPTCGRTVACAEDGSLVYFMVCCNDVEIPAIADTISREGRAWRP